MKAIIVTIFLTCCFSATAQEQPKRLFDIEKRYVPRSTSKLDLLKYPKAEKAVSFAPTFKVSELPFFCLAEYKIFQKSKINFRFRLGSVDYVDMLEQKH